MKTITFLLLATIGMHTTNMYIAFTAFIVCGILIFKTTRK
jgi:hypothetical protein